MKTTELYRSEKSTPGSKLTFRVCKAHGETRRLIIEYEPPDAEAEVVPVRIAVCEEDVDSFVLGTLAAAKYIKTSQPNRPDTPLIRVRKDHRRAYEPWSEHEDARLREEIASGTRTEAIAAAHERQPSAIRSRVRKLTERDSSE